MTFEEHKERKLPAGRTFADYEYEGKGSRQPWRGLVLMILFALFFLWLAWDRWHAIATAEETGATINLTTIEWGLYKVGGKSILSGFFALTGMAFLGFGIYNYRRLEKIKAG